MSTNYYAIKEKCKECGHNKTEIHIGKACGSYPFMFPYHSGVYYESIEEMKKWLKDFYIENEYGENTSHRDFWKMVEYAQKYFKNHRQENIIIIDGYLFIDNDFS